MSRLYSMQLARTTAQVVLLCLYAAAAPARASAQSLLDRTPNLTGGWVGAPGTIYFNFLHRFTNSAAPEKQISNSPTFLLGYTPFAKALVGVNYATRSDIAPRFPNEWEVFARYSLLSRVSLQAGYNNAAESVDGELGVAQEVGRLRLLGAARVLSNAFASDSTRFAVAGGATLRLTRWIALAGDVATPVDKGDDEKIGWGAALQIGIPNTPHTLSIQAANTNTATLQGSSHGGAVTRYGFEFTVPLHLARFKSAHAEQQSIPEGAVRVSMKQVQFAPPTITVARGMTVVWKNEDQLAHTVTAVDKSWTSALLQPGGVYVRTFDQPGRYEITCTPHPFMKMVVEVTP